MQTHSTAGLLCTGLSGHGGGASESRLQRGHCGFGIAPQHTHTHTHTHTYAQTQTQTQTQTQNTDADSMTHTH